MVLPGEEGPAQVRSIPRRGPELAPAIPTHGRPETPLPRRSPAAPFLTSASAQSSIHACGIHAKKLFAEAYCDPQKDNLGDQPEVFFPINSKSFQGGTVRCPLTSVHQAHGGTLSVSDE